MLDVDRGVDPERERQASEFLGVPTSVWQSATLRDVAFRVGGELPARHGVWPWILAIGARNLRRSGGLQYCPACLAADTIPYFRIRWRLAWHTACEVHSVCLQDECPACGSPLEPHRLGPESEHPAICARCAADITKGHYIDRASPEILEFQSRADSAIFRGEATFQGRPVCASTWFELAGFLTALVRREQCGNSKALTALLTALDAPAERIPIRIGAGIEMLRRRQRQALLFSVAKLIACDGKRFEQALHASGMSQQCFHGLKLPAPALLRELIDGLPQCSKLRRPGAVANARRRHPGEVRRMMISLERRMLGKIVSKQT